jgi:hypothetical protein
MEFVGKVPAAAVMDLESSRILDPLLALAEWLERNNYRGYDTFDGLSARYVRGLTLDSKFLRQVLQQSVRRFPLNVRPILGIPRAYSSKGMGFLARGFIRLHKATGNQTWADRARFALQWLMDNPSPGYSGACWGNHFDYQSRTAYFPKGLPTIVWTSLIGHAFLDAYSHFGDRKYLDIAVSACEHILRDIEVYPHGDGACISYVPGLRAEVHNANTLGASLLIRTYSEVHNPLYRDLAKKALLYTAQHQLINGAWYYGEKENLHWVDNFHTGYVLDCFKVYSLSTGDDEFHEITAKGYKFWKETFFLEDGTPRYYDRKTMPLDIQCSSQAIDTLVLFSDRDPDALSLALRVAEWTVANMQDKTGYFYYRRYSKWLVNKTPTLHWGQATMLCALGGLYGALRKREGLA